MPRNLGQQYEDYIKDLLKSRNLLPSLIPSDVDAGFIHKGKDYYLEVKNVDAPDYGAKKIIWSENQGWQWNDSDETSALFDRFNVISYLNANKTFTPKKHSLPDALLTEADKIFDRRSFADRIVLSNACSLLYDYYAQKNCFYIQIEGKGFYYLQHDIAGLNVPRFTPEITVRLRAKTHGSADISNYSFRAVITAKRNTIYPSVFDIEEEEKRKFPPFA